MKLAGGTIDLGNRSMPVPDASQRWMSVGVSAAADVIRSDFGRHQQDVTLTFLLKSETLKNAVDVYLNTTIKNMGLVSVTLDVGDDLGIAALGVAGGENTTQLRYVADSFTATWRTGVKWDISFSLRFFGS